MSGRGGGSFRGRGGGRGGASSSGRGGGAGGGGSFRGRGGAGRGRGGSAPRVRGESRDATTLESLFGKNTRYDHRVAKEKKFWDKSKKLRTYHRLLRQEGLEGAAGADDSGNDDTPASASGSAAPLALPTLQPEVFATGNDWQSRVPLQSHNKPSNKKRARAQFEGGDDGAAAAASSSSSAAGASSSAAASPSGSSLRAGGPLDPSMPDFKRRRLAPAELAKLKAEKLAAKAARQAALDRAREESAQRRAATRATLSERTARGQPVLGKQMELLVAKLQKQKADAAAAAAKK